MSKKAYLYSILLACLTSYTAQGQKPVTDSSFIGTWKGTSICQVKDSPCRDEMVVYYISKAEGQDTFSIKANKIVNGKEEEMGTIFFEFDRKSNQLISDSHGHWTFNIKGTSIDGTLISNGKLYRVIKVAKQP